MMMMMMMMMMNCSAHTAAAFLKSCVIEGFADSTRYTQKNGVVSKVNKKFISHLTRAQCTPSAAATVRVSHALPAVRFSCYVLCDV